MSKYDKVADYTSAAEFRRRSKVSEGIFRCQRCDRVMPESQLIEQDGNNICKAWCADAVAPSEVDLDVANLLATPDSWATNPLPTNNILSDAVAVTAWSVARPIRIKRPGTRAVTLTGVNFTSALTVTYDDAQITNSVGPTLTGTTQADFTISVGAGAVVGAHTMTVFGDTYFNCLQVY